MIQDFGGYRLSLVSRILVSGWLPVTTGYQNFGLRFVTGYHWSPNLTIFTGYHLLPIFWLRLGYQVTRIKTSVRHKLKDLQILLFKSGFLVLSVNLLKPLKLLAVSLDNLFWMYCMTESAGLAEIVLLIAFTGDANMYCAVCARDIGFKGHYPYTYAAKF